MDANSALQYGDSATAALNGSQGSVMAANRNLQNTLKQEDTAMQPAVQKFQQTAAQPIPQPPTPKQAAPAPDASDFTKDAQGWVSALAAFSSLIGARGRARGTGALKAFAGGVKGLQAGEQQAFDDSYKTWKANTDAMFKENDDELAKYKAVMDNRALSEAEAQQEMKMIGYQYQNKVMADTHTADQAFAVYDSIVKARTSAEAYVNKMEAKKEEMDREQDKKDAQLQETLKVFPTLKGTDVVPGVGMTKDAILQKVDILRQTGDNYPAAGISMRTINNPIRDFVDAVKAQGGKQDVVGERAAMASATSEARSIGTASGKIELAANSLDQSLPLLEDAMKKVDLSNFTDLNSVENYARSHTGDQNIVTLNTALQTTVGDYSTLIARNGQRTDATDAAAKHLANVNMANGQLQAFINQVRKEKEAQLRATKLTKEGKEGDAPAGAPAGGKTKIIGGVTYTQDANGDWHHD